MKIFIVILTLTLAVSAIALQHQPLSEELISYVNENAGTWTVIKEYFCQVFAENVLDLM